MRRIASLLLAVFAALLASAALAQEKSVNVGRVFSMTPKPGMSKQFEDGRKRHMDWHRKQNDSWRWETWQVETGPTTGSYVSVTFGHTFKDFDTWEAKLGAADVADTTTNLLPYLTENGDNSFWMVMPDISNMPQGNPNPKMAEVNHFLLRPGSSQDFTDAVKKIDEAIKKSNWPVHYTWYSLVDGGEAPHYVLLIYMNGWADLAEPEPSFPAMLEKGVGRHDAESLMHTIDKAIQRQWTETIRYRQDLSYEPK
jgi:hypothetical protein